MAEMMNKKLVLENGTVFEGYGFGADRDAVAELVFNTSMVGYQEIVSEHNYFEQMVVLTYPIIGSNGVNDEDDESKNPKIGGLIVRDYNDVPSNFRYTKTLSEAMEEDGIPGIYGLDTRMLTRIIRDQGSLRAMITDISTPTEQALETLRAWKPTENPVARLSCAKRWYSRTPNHRYNVVAVDCGIRMSSVRKFKAMGCNVTVVPYNTSAETVLALQADGLFISDGPGDPAAVGCITELIRALQGKLPILGVGLGHLLICLANGAKVEKMHVGHHGCNHPNRCLETGKIEIGELCQNYTVVPASLEGTDLHATYVNVLDGTVEAADCTSVPTFSAQFNLEVGHPMLQKFVQMMEGRKNNA